MNRRVQTRTILARTSQPRRAARLLLTLTAPALKLYSAPSTSSPRHRSLAWQGVEDDGGRTVWLTHCLLLQPNWWETRGYGPTAAWFPGILNAMQSFMQVFRYSAIPPRIFPAHPRSLASVLIPRPAARRDLLFRHSENLFGKSATTAERKDFPNLPKMRRLALGSGAHSRRFAQECPEGNPGKYKQGET